MHLTLLTDYALRVLLYLAHHPERIAPASEIATAYGVSTGHIAKAAKLLARYGYVATRRGKQGGLHLARPPESIRVSEVVRRFEPTMDLLECFDPQSNHCPISATCRLKDAFIEARAAFLDVLDRVTLADMARNSQSVSWTGIPRALPTTPSS